MAGALNNLGTLAGHRGDYRQARPFYEEALALFRSLGDSHSISVMLLNLGKAALHEGNCQQAQIYYLDCLALRQQLGDVIGIAHVLEGLAGVAGAQGPTQRAARLWGAAEALRETSGAALLPAERAGYEAMVSAARATSDQAEFAAAWTAGRALTPEQAAAEASVGV
jgi:tetratricopeptide (TPR) repeat protein